MINVWIAIGFATLLILAALVQWFIARRFRQHFVESKSFSTDDAITGKAAVLMAIRGADPSIENSINGVLNQSYSNFELQIVIDHPSDPAIEILRRISSQQAVAEKITVSNLSLDSDSCSLKCLSLSQAASRLSGDIEYVVLVDADVSPHPSWLADLLLPLSDESVGGVTGTQWFEPPAGSGFGTWLRSVWNSGAAILTMYFANPWAGSFAMRRSDLDEANLVDRWRQSMVDDGPIRSALNEIGKRVVFASPLVMVNREKCSLAFTLRWAERMLTWSRLHEPTFWVTIVHAVFSNFVMLSNFAVLIASLLGFLPPIAIGISLAALIAAGVFCSAAYQEARKCVNHSCRLRGDSPLIKTGMQAVWSFVCAAPAHLMFGWACLRSIFKRRIAWRGIQYGIPKNGAVKRLNYSPFVQSDKADNSI
jgi:glycosyltransferase involved in cell wall biosynthesis